MAENKEYITRQESMGTIQISEDVVASISSSVALETEGVGGLLNANMADLVGGKKMTAKGVRVEMAEDGVVTPFLAQKDVVVNLFLMIRYGFAIAEVAQKVQNAVYSALEGMTGFPVKAVNVHVGGISFD